MRQMFVPVSGSLTHSLWQAERVKAGRGLDVAEPSDSTENYCHLLLYRHTCNHSCPQCAGSLVENSGRKRGTEEWPEMWGRERVQVDDLNSDAAKAKTGKVTLGRTPFSRRVLLWGLIISTVTCVFLKATRFVGVSDNKTQNYRCYAWSCHWQSCAG